MFDFIHLSLQIKYYYVRYICHSLSRRVSPLMSHDPLHRVLLEALRETFLSSPAAAPFHFLISFLSSLEQHLNFSCDVSCDNKSKKEGWEWNVWQRRKESFYRLAFRVFCTSSHRQALGFFLRRQRLNENRSSFVFFLLSNTV